MTQPDYVFAPPPVPSLPVTGTAARFPIRRIFCVGRNYAAHVREMGGDPRRDPPTFFTKPADAVVENGATIPYPPATKDLHHEIELVVAIGGTAKDIAVAEAPGVVFGYAVGIDLTRRDIQAVARKAGGPWDMAKGFDRSAPCTAIRPVAEIGHPKSGTISLAVNGELRQNGALGDLIWSVAETIAQLSALVELRPGDLIFTGTPEGVGPVAAGDTLSGHIDGVGDLEIRIA